MQLKRDTLLERGKYRILETLGRGGFGITYLAEQVMTRRKVCIKEYFPKDYYNRDADTNRVYIGSQVSTEAMHKYKEKFIKEASVLAHLKHPHIVSVYDVFEENDTAYYVMEYVEGESLNAFVKRCGALDEAKAVGYIRQIADALGYIHEQNINHLDVKPSNVMVSSDDDGAILIDFGLAKHYDAVGEQTSSTPVGISHGYAPIEQYTSGGVREFSPSTDIYGLGATLYFLVTGAVPPHATDVGEEGLPKLPDHLSQGVRKAIERSMQYWRKDRLQSVKEFLKLLDDDKIVAPVAEATIINVETKSVDKSTVINVKPKQTPQPKNEPKPKKERKSKGGLWLGIFLFILAAVASFILFGGGSSKKESAPKSAVAMVDTLASSSDSLNLAKPKVDTLQLNDTPKEGPKEESKEEPKKPLEAKPVTRPESPTKEDAKPVTQPNNEIWYTSSDGKVVKPSQEGKYIFGAVIESNTYKNGKGTLKFKGDVTKIGWSAFGYCESLKSVTIPNSVTMIGEGAFRECISLTSVTIPNSVTAIESDAFWACDSLKEFKSKFASKDGRCLIIDGELVAFAPAGITEYTIPNSVTTIGRMAFYQCDNLTSVTIPNSVTAIESDAFWACDSLKEFKSKFASKDGRCLIINGKLVAFAPAGITEYTIPDSVTTIGDAAFWGCESLKSVTIPNSVTTIGDAAFRACSNLASVTIPNSVTTIGDAAFAWCSNLKSVTIPNSVTTIGDAAFRDCSNLTSVTIPNSVTTIEVNTFYNCQNLKSVTIPNSVTTIGNYAFYECMSLKSVTIPNSVTTIGKDAFSCCDNLTSITIPNSVTTIGEYAFSGCHNLKEFKGGYAFSKGRCLIINGKLVAFAPAEITKFTIPDSVTTIGENAFYGCDNLTSVTIPNSVKKIGEWAFGGCSSLKEFKSKFATPDGRCLIVNGKLVAFAPAGITKFTIPDSVTKIGNYAFSQCKSLTSVTIPNSVTTIGEWAFYKCESLKSVTIPNSVTTIGWGAFIGCDNLSEETKNNIKKIDPEAL